MHRISPTSLKKYDLHQSTEALAFAVIEYDDESEIYTLYSSVGESVPELVVSSKEFSYELGARRGLGEFIEEMVNNGFCVIEELPTILNKPAIDMKNIGATHSALSCDETCDAKSVVMPYVDGENAILYIDIFTNTCSVTRSDGSAVTLSDPIIHTLTSCLDGFEVSSLLMNVSVCGDRLNLLDFIQVNEHYCSKIKQHKWLKSRLGKHKAINLCPIKPIKKGESLIDCFDKFLADDTLVVSNDRSSLDERNRLITTLNTVNLIVSQQTDSMLTLSYLKGLHLTSCCLLPKRQLAVNYMDVVSVEVIPRGHNLFFSKVVAKSGPEVSIDSCVNPSPVTPEHLQSLSHLKSFGDDGSFSEF